MSGKNLAVMLLSAMTVFTVIGCSGDTVTGDAAISDASPQIKAIQSAATPSAASQEQVQKAYIAYYGRPADPGGLAYWAARLDGSGGNWSPVIDAFGNSTEATSLLAGLTGEQKIDKIYNQLFGRNADPAGRAFYASGLASGSFTLASLAINIINGVSGANADATAVANKLAAAQLFTASLNSDTKKASYNTATVSAVRNWLAAVTRTATTQASVDSLISSIGPAFTMDQTISDGAQRTTLAFSGLAMMTGNLEAQSFFPPGKVADYTGFQYLRDNDPDNMGHNTSFLTRVANNVIYILNDSQFAQLKTLATAQLDQINLYGYKRFPLMKAFRRLLDGDIPSGSAGLNLNAVKKASRELYLLDGQISFDRALLYADILNSLNATQRTYLEAMKGRGWNSWPDVTNDQVQAKMKGLPQGTSVAVMTYASDLFSWYAGSVEADVYFCPERHGTYYGSFYIKDAPAIGHEGYSIDEQLTATAGAALSDSSKGYVTPAQAALMSSLVTTQRNKLYASPTANIVTVRTEIATLLRSLLTSTASSDAVKARVLALSETYGDLDGENNHAYATVFAQVYNTLTTDQKSRFAALRKSIMSGTYTDGTTFDYSVTTTPFLYSSVIADRNLLTPYIGNTDSLFFEP